MEQNSDSKRVAKNSLLLYMRMFVLMGIGLFTSRIILNALGVEDYGIYNVVGGIVVLLSFLNNAMAGATQRYINVALGRRDQQQLNTIISNSVILHYIIGFVCVLIAESLGLWYLNEVMVIPEGRENAAFWVYQISVLTFFLGIITTPYNASIIAHEKMSAFAWITIIDVLMKLIIVCSLLYVNTDKLILYAILLCINSNITRVIYIQYCKRHFEECRIKSWKIDKPLMKSMMSFSSWTIFGNLGYLAHTQGIALVINFFFGVTVNAAQGIANQVNGYVKQFVTNFLMAFNPQVVKTYAAGEMEEMHKLVIRGCKISLMMVGALVIPLIIEMPMILHLWLGLVPEYAVIFVRLILLLTLFDSYSSLMATAKGATGDIKVYQIVLTTIGLFHLPLTWVCFQLGWEPYWAQIVYVIIIIILSVVRTAFVCKAVHLSQQTFYKQAVFRGLFTIMASAILPLILHYSIDNDFARLISVCVSSVFCSVLGILFFGFLKSERNQVLSLITNKIKRHV